MRNCEAMLGVHLLLGCMGLHAVAGEGASHADDGVCAHARTARAARTDKHAGHVTKDAKTAYPNKPMADKMTAGESRAAAVGGPMQTEYHPWGTLGTSPF
jgi:hypothetical protein